MAKSKRSTRKQRTRKNKQPRNRQMRPTKAGNRNVGTTIVNVQSGRTGLMDNTFYAKVCSQVNPFCAEAVGAKIYDIASAKTLTSCIRYLQPITTNANGDAMVFFRGQLLSFGSVATVVGGIVTAWVATGSVPNYADYLANCSRYRIVSFGVRCVPTVASSVASGLLVCTEVDTAPPITTTGVSSLNIAPVNIVRSVPGDPLFWVSRPTDLEYTDFKPINDGSSDLQRTMCTISVVGSTPSAVVALCEIVMNIELVPLSGTIGALFPTAPNRAVPQIMDVSSDVLRNINPIHSGSESSFAATLENEVKSLANTALKSGGSYLRSAVMGALLA